VALEEVAGSSPVGHPPQKVAIPRTKAWRSI
jgi:hypothetical protein